jgi:ABC-type spermidine/putrescine transport system permease subunit II
MISRVFWAYSWLLMAFILVPLFIISLMSFTSGEYLQFPPQGFSLAWYNEFLETEIWIRAFKNSILIGLASAIGATSIGATVAFALDRYDYWFEDALSAIAILPVLLPPVIVGVAFVSFFGVIGAQGHLWKLFIAHSITFSPFPFVLISQGLADLDQSYEEAARGLGSNPLTVIRSVTIPLLRSNIFAGCLFVFVLSLNEYIVSWLISGFSFTTVPIQIFSTLRYSYSPVIAVISFLFIVITGVVMVMADYLSGGLWD